MGGQFNYWGLWLDSEYGHGQCSETCSTFKNYTQLSVNKHFEIRNIEVWAVGEKPKTDEVSLRFRIAHYASYGCDCKSIFIFISFIARTSLQTDAQFWTVI